MGQEDVKTWGRRGKVGGKNGVKKERGKTHVGGGSGGGGV